MIRALLLAAFLLPRPAAAEEVVVVLGSDLAAYREALTGFQQAFRGRVDVFLLGRDAIELPSDARVIVAIGSRAALRSYPPDLPVVACLAPGLRLAAHEHPAGAALVPMLPRPSVLASKLAQALPARSRVGMLWSAPGYDRYARDLAKAASAAGVQIVPIKVPRAAQLPDALRRAVGRVDALWTPPDPLLSTRDSLETVRAFAAAQGLTFASSTPGVTPAAGTVSITTSFAEAGRAAALAAQDALDGEVGEVYYPTEVTVSGASARGGDPIAGVLP